MSDIVVIVSPAKAEEVRKKLFDFARAVFDRIVRGGHRDARCFARVWRAERSYKTKRRCATVTPNGSIGRSIGYPASFPAAQGASCAGSEDHRRAGSGRIAADHLRNFRFSSGVGILDAPARRPAACARHPLARTADTAGARFVGTKIGRMEVSIQTMTGWPWRACVG